jgi:predicted amidohydrolase
MKICHIQFAPVLGEIDANIAQLDRMLADCTGADLIVLPELCSTGYNFASREQAFQLSETYERSRFLDFLAAKCGQYGFHVVAGFDEREGERLFNSAALVGPEGPLGRYRKIHLFWNEKDIFEPGDLGLPVFEVAGAKIGILICFDWQFPEVWRVLALKGAEVVCHPSNLVLPKLAQRAVPLHAMLNRFFVVLANRIGSEGELTFTGRSLICDPRGNVISEAPADKPFMGAVEIDPAAARDKSVTPRNDLIKDRRPGEYGLLAKEN